ncbi:hypothetical protein M231_07691 [Tremella mesenterica]|uniref:Uncharacterized protein n=1 Tax=Tremella mesenterica TaxID=5217 RepID=A0A4Q1B8H1_TREME|nr:uncharacterized protein TREMEDRAFT_58610 [Tremella mesenterica DSM 1558]EIW72446.1 hypothetical protein TREMEDRAFT_58610 [Tremella mesenterica DSM 1558]RXK35038.1 hypothetical protein M231_07691 [Tremella mesenterica]
MRLVSTLNALSTSIATVVNSSDVGPSSRTELARVSREQLTSMNDFCRTLYETPFVLNPVEFELPPTLDWLKTSKPSRLSSQDAAFLNVLVLPLECLRTLRQLWKSPSLTAARDPSLHAAHIGALNAAWKEAWAIRRVGQANRGNNSGDRQEVGGQEESGQGSTQ